MPANFPELWLNRVQQNLSNTDQDTFLDGIQELDVNVTPINEGTETELNLIHIPISYFNPEVVINNNSYPLPVQGYSDQDRIITLDKFQSYPTQLSDDEILGSSYSKIDAVTRVHVSSIASKKLSKAIWNIAPDFNMFDTPILQATGPTNPTTGYTTLTYEDLVNAKNALDVLGAQSEGRRMVLSGEHYNDLLKDRLNFGNLLIDYREGMTAPVIAGFEIRQYMSNPYIMGGSKMPYGMMMGTFTPRASIFFLKSMVFKKSGFTKQYFHDAKTDPEHQTNRLSYRHYHTANRMMDKYVGAITSV